MPASRVARMVVLLWVLVCLGCGSSDAHKTVVPVRGSVLVGGKPAVKALLVFHALNESDAKAPRPTGEVAADGTFSLSTHTTGDGAPPGEYAVTVLWPEASSAIGGDADSGADRLGNRYSNPRTTRLRARINDGPTELKPFQLEP